MSTEALVNNGKRSVDDVKRLTIAVLLPLVYALFGITWMGMVPLLPEVTAGLHVATAEGVLLITIISMVKSIVPILTGVVAARLGLTTTLRLAAVLLLAGGIAPWLTSYDATVLVRGVFGIGGAMWVTLMGSVVLSVLKAEQRPVANAVNGIAVNVGVVVALATTLPLTHAIGVQWTLTLGSLLSVLCAVVLFALGPIGKAQPTPPMKDTLLAYASTLKLPATWLLAVAFCGPLALYLVLNTFLAQHLQAAFDIPRAEATQWMSYLNLWGVPASLGAGFVITRSTRAPRIILLVASVMTPLALVVALLTPSSALRAVAFALVGMGMFLPVSPLVTTMQKMPGQTAARLGMIFGTMFAVTYLVSAAVPTWVKDRVASGTPLSSALLVAALLGASPLFGLLLDRSTRGTPKA